MSRTAWWQWTFKIDCGGGRSSGRAYHRHRSMVEPQDYKKAVLRRRWFVCVCVRPFCFFKSNKISGKN